MRAILQSQLAVADVTATNAPALLSGQAEWVASTAYDAGAVVARSVIGSIFRAVYAVPATAQAPEDDIAKNAIPKWQAFGATNPMAAFDGIVRTKTIGPAGTDLVMTFNPGAASTIWVGDVAGTTSVRCVLKDAPGGTVVYDQTVDLRAKIDSWFAWWFAPTTMRRDAIFSDIPPYHSGEATLTFATAATASVGMVAAGTAVQLGTTLEGPQASAHGYTTKTVDSAWGPSEGSGGNVVSDPTFTVAVKPEDAPMVNDFMLAATTQPAVWIPDDDAAFAALRVFGQCTAHMKYDTFGMVTLDITVRSFL